MTTGQIYRAAEGFDQPFGSRSRLRAHLTRMRRDGLIQMTELPRVGPGRGERLFYLSRRAKYLAPEVGDLSRGHRLLRLPAPSRMEHSMGIAESLSYLHQDAARSGGRVKILGAVGDHYLRFHVDPRRYGLAPASLSPDATLLLEVDGQVQLLFLELMNRGAVIKPGCPRSAQRSFQGKLFRYKALARELMAQQGLAELFEEFCLPMPRGFRVLVVSTRTDIHLRHLMAATPPGTRLAYFARLAGLQADDTNAFLDPVWQSPSGEAQTLA